MNVFHPTRPLGAAGRASACPPPRRMPPSTWSTAYEQALRHDPAKLAADEALVAGREKAVQGDALLRPRVSLQAGVNRIDDHSSGNSPSRAGAYLFVPSGQHRHGTRQAGVQLTQPLYDANARAPTSSSFTSRPTSPRRSSTQSRQDLVQRVAEAYFGVLLARGDLRVAQAEKAALGLQRDRAQARFDVGRGKITDLQEAQARYDQVVTKEISARSTLDLRRARVPRDRPACPPKAWPGSPPTSPRARRSPTASRPGRRAARTTARSCGRSAPSWRSPRAEIGKYRLAGRPTLNLVASYTARGKAAICRRCSASDRRSTGSVGLQFNVPLYAGGAHRLARARVDREARPGRAGTGRGAARRRACSVQDAFLAVTTGVSRVASLTSSRCNRPARHSRPPRSGATWARARSPTCSTRSSACSKPSSTLAQARFDYLLGRVRLSAAAGELAESDVRNLNGLLASR